MITSSPPDRLSDRFNAFLRSGLWLDRDATPLSVLSALARLDVDPWEEAAQLAALPEVSASAKLASMLSALPGGPAAQRDLEALCTRTVRLLPSAASPGRGRVATVTNPGPRPRLFLFFVLASWMVALTLMVAQGPAGHGATAYAALAAGHLRPDKATGLSRPGAERARTVTAATAGAGG